MATVIVSPFNVINFPEGGGHFWVCMQYIQGLRRAGCEVYWLEEFRPGKDPLRDAAVLASFFERMRRFDMDKRAIVYSMVPDTEREGARPEYLDMACGPAEAILRRADLLLNFHYTMHPTMRARFCRTALVDIDPGLLQFWMSTGQLRVTAHDHYLTIGETVGTERARFPDCGLPWTHIHPPVCLELWPYVHDVNCEAFTTVAGWWAGEWIKEIVDGREVLRENTKRVSFLEFADLPRLTSQPLELALYLADDDGEDRQLLEDRGWRVRHSREVAQTPERYQAYIQRSRGEISCAKPSCMRFQNAWVSDRTLCYLASGKPVVVQDTGPSSTLPNGLGMFRFSSVEEAAEALQAVNADYARHCRAARELAEAYFDATKIARQILDITLG
jgi:hypothetical protein